MSGSYWLPFHYFVKNRDFGKICVIKETIKKAAEFLIPWVTSPFQNDSRTTGKVKVKILHLNNH